MPSFKFSKINKAIVIEYNSPNTKKSPNDIIFTDALYLIGESSIKTVEIIGDKFPTEYPNITYVIRKKVPLKEKEETKIDVAAKKANTFK